MGQASFLVPELNNGLSPQLNSNEPSRPSFHQTFAFSPHFLSASAKTAPFWPKAGLIGPYRSPLSDVREASGPPMIPEGCRRRTPKGSFVARFSCRLQFPESAIPLEPLPQQRFLFTGSTSS